jgi:hypothetical protein
MGDRSIPSEPNAILQCVDIEDLTRNGDVLHWLNAAQPRAQVERFLRSRGSSPAPAGYGIGHDL